MSNQIKMRRNPLYAILDELSVIGEAIEEAVASNDAAALEAVKARESELAAKLVAKVDRLADVLDHMKAQEDVCRKRVREVERKARTWANQRERLRGYVLAVMESRGITRLESETTSFSVEERAVKAKPRLLINPTLLPLDYFTRLPNESRIYAAIKAGVTVPGVTVVHDPAPEPKKVLVQR